MIYNNSEKLCTMYFFPFHSLTQLQHADTELL